MCYDNPFDPSPSDQQYAEASDYARNHPGTNTSAYIEQSLKASSYANRFGETERGKELVEQAAMAARATTARKAAKAREAEEDDDR